MPNPVNDSGTSTYFRAETVPARKYQPNQVKRDIRAFERWFDAAKTSWPDELRDLGATALLALKTLDQPNVLDAMTRAAAEDLANFNTAYAAFVASKGA